MKQRLHGRLQLREGGGMDTLLERMRLRLATLGESEALVEKVMAVTKAAKCQTEAIASPIEENLETHAFRAGAIFGVFTVMSEFKRVIRAAATELTMHEGPTAKAHEEAA